MLACVLDVHSGALHWFICLPRWLRECGGQRTPRRSRTEAPIVSERHEKRLGEGALALRDTDSSFICSTRRCFARIASRSSALMSPEPDMTRKARAGREARRGVTTNAAERPRRDENER